MKRDVTIGVSMLAMVAAAQPATAQEAGPPRALSSPTTIPATIAAQDVPPAPPAAPAPGTADQAEGGLQDIVVTAQRREETIQRAALAITAVSGDQLQTRGVSSAEGIGRLTAGLQVTPSTGPYATFTVRGITQLSGNAFSDPAVAVNLNGVYLASPTAIRGLFYDVERVEILKGPQGTLYGRNATAGAINVIPKRPRFRFGAEGGFDIGNYDRFDINAALNLPVSDTVAFRVAGQRARRDGFFSDGTSDENVDAVRAQLLFQPTDTLSILLMGDYAHQGGRGVGGTLRKRCANYSPARTGGIDGNCFAADNPFTGFSDLSGEYARFGFAPQTRNMSDDSNYYGLSLNADWKTSLGTVTLIGGYRKSALNWRSSATSWHFIARDRPQQKSAELRLASPGRGPLQYVFGAFYLDTENHSRQNGENAATPNFSDQYNNLTGWTGALFSQLTYSLSDTFRVTGGLRYTHEKKESDSRRYVLANLTGPDPILPATEPTNLAATVLRRAETWNRVNWKAGLEWDVGPRSLLYANVSTGFKAGGFFYGAGANLNGVLDACAVNCVFQPENVKSYVLGSKNRFLNNKVQLNAEAFYLDYSNQQVSLVKLFNFNGALSSVLVTDNAGKSRNYGVEVEADVLLTPTTRLGTQFQYLNSKYKQFSYITSAAGAPPTTSACGISAPVNGQVTVDCGGQPGLRTPRWRVLGSIQQTIRMANAGRFLLEGNMRYESAFQSDVSYIPETRNYATTRFDLSVGYVAPQDRFTIKAYIDNVTDEVTISMASQNNSYARTRISAAGPSRLVGVNLAPPRTYGIRGQVKF